MLSPMTKAGVPLDRRIQGRVLHIARKPLGIETDGAGDGEHAIKVEGAVRPQRRPAKRLVEARHP